MNQHVRRLFNSCAAVAALLTSIVSTVRAQDAGTISGRVIDAASNAPVPSAQVQIVGTTRGAVTGDDGRYRIAAIRPGQYQVRALRLGYQASSQTVDVTAGRNAGGNLPPAAAAQYGTAAANGVIQITTKRGRSGRPRWTTFVEGGTIRDVTDYPANYLRVANERNANGSRRACTLDSQTRALCTPNPDSLLVFNPLVANSPFINGHRGAYGASVAGGSDQVTYYASG